MEHAVAPALGGYWTPERMARAIPIDLLPAIGEMGGAGRIGGMARGVLPAPGGAPRGPAEIPPPPAAGLDGPGKPLPGRVLPSRDVTTGDLTTPDLTAPATGLSPTEKATRKATRDRTARERARPVETGPAAALTGPAKRLARPAKSLAKPGKSLGKPGKSLGKPGKRLATPGEALAAPRRALTNPDLLAAGRLLPPPAKFLRDQGRSLPRPAKPAGALRRGLALPGAAGQENGDAARLRQFKSARQAVAPGSARGKAAIAAPASTTNGSHWASGGSVTRTTGRVFLTMKGVDFVCSASAVRSANRDVVVTAGHCVKDGAGPWAENWTFVPGYQGGRQPYGAFSARRMFVPGPWSRGGDDDYDVGMVAVTRREGRHLTDLVGGQEIGFFPQRGVRTYGFGFPADPPYDGEHLLYCAGAVHGDPQRQTQDQGLRCDLTAGASGGPWLTDFDPATGRGTLTSVSSFKYSNDRGTMYGPYFSTATRDLFQLAEGA
ncbi:hypothetical protein GCM10023194_13960 [Planotetraspora phitsanulokensis]|uniref:Peptidase S1 domain-containing protein n=1 Tax=Planotetraspora phitsanulokensis TaxID=575192 RepID=A0A8J3XGF4_9ACTN|nr:hypothetical protein Pph01_39940 [Planotetraspora phitsanulokensis]